MYPLCPANSPFIRIVALLKGCRGPTEDEWARLDMSQERCQGGSARTSRAFMHARRTAPDQPDVPRERLPEGGPDHCAKRLARSDLGHSFEPILIGSIGFPR